MSPRGTRPPGGLTSVDITIVVVVLTMLVGVLWPAMR